MRLAGRVAIVTGAGRGIGRSHALALARHGARVVVNDVGASLDGIGGSMDASAAAGVVREIEDLGGEAIVDSSDVGSWSQAETLVRSAIERFGALDIVVNNAGILRPRTLVGLTEGDVSDVLRVHLFGSFAVSRFAAVHWRERHKRAGRGGGRLINTTSAAGLFGAGQSNYAAAKAGIAALTIVAAEELSRYGATVNAISPIALTRMSVGIAPESFGPEHVGEFASWLASDSASGVSGHVFSIGGGHVSIVDRWHAAASIDRADGWTVDDLDTAMPDLLSRASPHPDATGYRPDEARPEGLPSLTLPRGDTA